MAKIMKPIRMEEDLIKLVEEKGKGKDFTEKIHNTLYFYFKEEDRVKERIKQLEKKEQELKKSIQGLEAIRSLSKNVFVAVGDLFESIGRGNKYQIDNTMKHMNDMLKSIKDTL